MCGIPTRHILEINAWICIFSLVLSIDSLCFNVCLLNWRWKETKVINTNKNLVNNIHNFTSHSPQTKKLNWTKLESWNLESGIWNPKETFTTQVEGNSHFLDIKMQIAEKRKINLEFESYKLQLVPTTQLTRHKQQLKNIKNNNKNTKRRQNICGNLMLNSKVNLSSKSRNLDTNSNCR